MPSPDFLTLADVLAIHADQRSRYGGAAGVRDQAALESAVAMPQGGIGDTYFHADLYEMAAAYLFHIVCNHPFVDGNKRTGAVAAAVFLELNDLELTAPEEDFERMVLVTAEGNLVPHVSCISGYWRLSCLRAEAGADRHPASRGFAAACTGRPLRKQGGPAAWGARATATPHNTRPPISTDTEH